MEGTNVHTGAVVRAKLNLIDLAGSERISKTDATGDRLRCIQAQILTAGYRFMYFFTFFNTILRRSGKKPCLLKTDVNLAKNVQGCSAAGLIRLSCDGFMLCPIPSDFLHCHAVLFCTNSLVLILVVYIAYQIPSSPGPVLTDGVRHPS